MAGLKLSDFSVLKKKGLSVTIINKNKTDRLTDRDRQTETERKRERQRQRQRERQRETETETERQRQRKRQTDRQAGRQTYARVSFE